jgi:hypothetical protein
MLNTFSHLTMFKLRSPLWQGANSWALIYVQAHHATSPLYIHRALAAADSFKSSVNINQTARCQIFNYESVSSQNNTDVSCYFRGDVFIHPSDTEADRWSVQWIGERNVSFGTRRNKNKGAETQEPTSGRSMSCEWLLYLSFDVTRIALYVA